MTSRPIHAIPVARFSPLFSGLVVLALYLLTAPHGLTWDLGGADGGELATAVYTVGLAHSPGYPTYLLLAQTIRLVPLASVAYRLNLFSAVAASAAAAMLSRVIGDTLVEDSLDDPRTSAMRLIGSAVGLLFGLAEVVWSQAIITEVYALAALFCVALLALTFYTAHAENQRQLAVRLLLLGLVAGLGLGSHFVTGFMTFFAGLYLLFCARRQLLVPSSLFAALGFALGLAVFAYIPLRAGKVPVSDWGDPTTLQGFLRVVTAGDYLDRLQVGLMTDRLAALVRLVVTQTGIVGLAVISLGLSEWWDNRRRLLATVAATVALNLWFVAQYDSADTQAYVYPTLLLLSLTAASGLKAIVLDWPLLARLKGPVRIIAVGAVLLALWLPPGLYSWQVVSTASTEAEAYSRKVVDAAPQNAIVISGSDEQTFAIRYAATVMMHRPDLVLIDAGTWSSFDWYVDDLDRFYPGLTLSSPPTPDRTLINFLLRLKTKRPVVLTYNPGALDVYKLIPLTPELYLLTRPETSSAVP